MAICWKCPQCQRTLSIGSRKMHSRIHCPGCGRPQTVPGAAGTGFRPQADRLEPVSPRQRPTAARHSLTPLVVVAAALLVGSAVLFAVYWRAHTGLTPRRGEPALSQQPTLAPPKEAFRNEGVPDPATKAPREEGAAAREERAKPDVEATRPPTQPELGPLPRVKEQLPKAPPVTRLSSLSADRAGDQLAKVPELDFVAEIEKLRKEAVKPEGKDLAEDLKARQMAEFMPPREFVQKVNDRVLKLARAEGLPLRMGKECTADGTTAKNMGTLSTTLRTMGFVSVPGAPTGRRAVVVGTVPATGVGAFKDWCHSNNIEKYPGAIPTLVQMLQIEEEPVRLLLIEQLASVDTREGTGALAKRALFDTSADLRQAAIELMKKRRPDHRYRQALLEGLRYPWAPVADRAAEALVLLNDRGAVPQLVELLDQPDPARPVFDAEKKKHVVRELVQINHMRNCYLCHAPSESNQPGQGMVLSANPKNRTAMAVEEPVRGRVPKVGVALPVAYYGARTPGEFVRADITYLKQDFSVCRQVENPGNWPAVQRYDYVIRTRTATPEELAKLKERQPNNEEVVLTYPQRDAVLYTLHKLTGLNGGDTSEGWREVLRQPADSRKTIISSPGEK
jgi:hypothetical protein